MVVSEVEENGWKIVSCVSTARLTASYNQVTLASILVISLLFLLFYLFSRYFLGQIITPLHTVVEGMKEMEEGNLTVHVEPAGQSEIRTMIHSFNRMVRELRASIEEMNRYSKRSIRRRSAPCSPRSIPISCKHPELHPFYGPGIKV